MPQNAARKYRPPNIRMCLLFANKRQAEPKNDNKMASSLIRAILKKASTMNALKSTEKQAKRTKTTNDHLPGDHRRLPKHQH
eukprot:827516-Ditylum_brightwellii.AAC.1